MPAAPRRRATVALAVASTVVALALGELLVRRTMPSIVNGVRVFRYAESERAKFCQYSEDLGWEGIPSAAGSFAWLDARSTVRQNEYGFRGTAHPLARGPRRRIAVLGDSFAWGFGVDEGALFTDVLERDDGVEVVNLGVSGYGTDQELLEWETKGAAWRPDDVWLLVTFFTDLDDIAHPVAYGYPKPVFTIAADGVLELSNVPVPHAPAHGATEEIDRRNWATPLRPLIDHSDLFCGVLGLLARAATLRPLLEAHHLVPKTRPGYDFEYAFYRAPDAPMEEAWRLFAKLVETLAAQVERAGARLTLVIVPSATQVYPEVWRAFVARAPAGAAAGLDPELPVRRLRAVADALHVPAVDLGPALRAAGAADAHLYFPLNYHWTAAGHRVVADTLRRELLSR